MYKCQKNKKMALNSGIQTNQILTNNDEVCIPRLSSIFLAVTEGVSVEEQNFPGKEIECHLAVVIQLYISTYFCISDVESQEDARLCNFWEDVCYGKLTIAEVNVTLSQGSIIDLIEIKIQKGMYLLIIKLGIECT